MKYLLVFFICFLVSGILFGLTVLLQRALKKKPTLQMFAMPAVALIPAILVCTNSQRTILAFYNLIDYRLWALAVLTAGAVSRFVQMAEREYTPTPRIEIKCLAAAAMEIVQRFFMQTFALWLLQIFGLKEWVCILITAVVFAADIYVQTLFTSERNFKKTSIEAIASFVFSMGIGYVFFASQCFVMPVFAHVLERAKATKLEEKRSREKEMDLKAR